MTTDTTALQERIAEELYYDQHPEGRHRCEWPTAVYPDDVYEYRDLAAAVLPIIARVRRDAERGAIDWLIADKAHMTALLRAENGGEAEDVLAHFRDTHCPEETP